MADLKSSLKPGIIYRGGIARCVVEYIDCNGDLASVETTLEDGKYSIKTMDPEHGGSPTRSIDKSYLEKLEATNPDKFPVAKVLGSAIGEVEKILAEKGLTARHINLDNF